MSEPPNNGANANEWPFEAISPAMVIRFNDYAAPRPPSTVTSNQFYTNDPVIELTLNQAAPRVLPLPSSYYWLPTQKAVFDKTPIYAAYGGNLQVVSITDAGENTASPAGGGAAVTDAPLAILPPQPKNKKERGDELQEQVGPQQKLCLFNILVALEWRPSPRYLRQLQWGFRQASDFLYDVTDGYMAIGQVVFGGIELMKYADIQIFASSRLFPRSWVSGMYEEQKHSPIRVGSGLWKKNTRTLIPWDEPEGFRILVHEFAHYALGLKDRYLDRRVAVRATALGQPDPTSNRLVDWNLVFPQQKDAKLTAQGLDGSEQVIGEQPVQWSKLVVPSIALAVETIMSNLEGASELTLRRERAQTSEWDDLRARFRRLELPDKTTVDSGPGRLPLPLPEFGIVQAGATRAEFPIVHPAVTDTIFSEGSNEPAEQLIALPTLKYPTPAGLCIDPESCWAYVLRGGIQNPTGLIAQGSLPAHADEHDHSYVILGVEVDDLIVLIGEGYVQPIANLPEGTPTTPVVLCAEYTGDNLNLDWYSATPESFPIVDVCPDGQTTTQPPYHITIRVIPGDTSAPSAWVGYLFPFGAPPVGAPDHLPILPVDFNEDGSSATIGPLTSLDGHVLLVSGDKTKAGKHYLTIATYSIGGSPSSAFPPHPNPITAGSSEGNSMIFFYDLGLSDEPSARSGQDDKVVVTTLNLGIRPPSGVAPRSYTFSMATNRPLPMDLMPTLVLFFDTKTVQDIGDLLIYRYEDNAKGADRWLPIPTYVLAGAAYAAAPLRSGLPGSEERGTDVPVFNSAAGLLGGNSQLIERYRLGLVQPSAAAKAR